MHFSLRKPYKISTLQARKTHVEKRLAESRNPSKEIWKVINEEAGTKSRSHIISVKNPLTNTNVLNKEAANTLNEHVFICSIKVHGSKWWAVIYPLSKQSRLSHGYTHFYPSCCNVRAFRQCSTIVVENVCNCWYIRHIIKHTFMYLASNSRYIIGSY